VWKIRLWSRLPRCLSKVRPLATHLEHEPLSDVVLLLQRIVRQRRIQIVMLDKVLDDSPSFPKYEIGVGILDGL
jgi:hypothetical protein